jgi:hypothetical protein
MGCGYTSVAFGKRCEQAGVRPSMGSVGDGYDDALAENFFATLEYQRLDRRRFRDHAEARMAVFDFIEAWYNPYRRHSRIGYDSPVNYEKRLGSAASTENQKNDLHTCSRSHDLSLSWPVGPGFSATPSGIRPRGENPSCQPSTETG